MATQHNTQQQPFRVSARFLIIFFLLAFRLLALYAGWHDYHIRFVIERTKKVPNIKFQNKIFLLPTLYVIWMEHCVQWYFNFSEENMTICFGIVKLYFAKVRSFFSVFFLTFSIFFDCLSLPHPPLSIVVADIHIAFFAERFYQREWDWLWFMSICNDFQLIVIDR